MLVKKILINEHKITGKFQVSLYYYC